MRFGIILFLWLNCAVTQTFALSANDNYQLKLNSTVAAAFNSGEHHFYRLELKSGEVAELFCERNEIDIKLSVFAPNGGQILASNAPDGFVGSEKLVFAADKPGEYKIEINSRRPGIFHGNYKITLKDQRAPNETDKAEIEAMRLSGEAGEIVQGAENHVEKAVRALERLDKALALFEKSGDLDGQAKVIFRIAAITGNETGDSDKAAILYQKAAAIWTQTGDEAGKFLAVLHAGNELRESGGNNKIPAAALFKQALEINRKLGSVADQAVVLAFICRISNNSGNFQKGFETCRQSLKITQNNDPLTDYFTYTTLGSLYENTGGDEDSLKNYQTGFERAVSIKDYLNPIRAAIAQGNKAIILQRQQKYTEAAENYQAAIDVAETVKRPQYVAYFTTQLATLYYETNEFGKGLEFAEKSLALYRRILPIKRQIALNAVGKNAAALGQMPKARVAFDEALEINRLNKDRYAEAETLYNLSKIERDEGNLEIAESDIDQSISISEIIRSELLGKTQRSSYLSILKRYYELKIEILWRRDEKNPGANYSEQAWQMQEKSRARSLLENFLESGADFSANLPKDFFTREKILLEKIAAAETNRANSLKLKNASAQTAAENNLRQTLDEYNLWQEESRSANPQFFAVKSPADFSFADAQKTLDGATAYLEYSLGEKQSGVWLIAKNSVKFYKLPARAEINRQSLELYRALSDRTTGDQQLINQLSQQLSARILMPLSADAAKFHRLVVIADGALQLIPFSALTTSSDAVYRPLVTDTEIINEPSLSTLIYLQKSRAARTNSPEKSVAVLADPIFEQSDERFVNSKTLKNKSLNQPAKIPDALLQTLRDFGVDRLARLPFTGIEARNIIGFAGEKSILAIGANASREKFLRGDFDSYRILHFATHGFLNQRTPDLSGLVLSLYDEKRHSQNGFLRVIDLYSIKLHNDLVVLSACQTGLGKDVEGEGIIGLTRGFMYAGASGVVSSLWKVDDAATAELMKRFYRAMLKENKSPSAALQIAKNEIRQIPRFKNPQNWAGFTLTGDWH